MEIENKTHLFVDLIFYMTGIGGCIFQLVKNIKGLKYYQSVKPKEETYSFILKDMFDKLIENKKRNIKTEIFIQMYYMVVLVILFHTSIINKINSLSLFKYELLTNHVFIGLLSLMNCIIDIPVLITRMIIKYQNNYKEPIITLIGSYLSKFSLYLIFNIVLVMVLNYVSFHGMYLVVGLISAMYHFITNIIMVHMILPQRINEEIQNEEIKQSITKFCEENGIKIKSIKTTEYMAVSFCGSEDEKTLVIGKEIINNCSKEEINGYILYNLGNNFDKSIKFTMIESINSFVFYYLLEYLYFNSNLFYNLPQQNISIGIFVVEYLFENVSSIFTMTINSIEYYWNVKGINNIKQQNVLYFKQATKNLLQSTYFSGDELIKLNKIEKQEEQMEITRELKYRNPLYREGDDDDDGHDNDCECENCEFKRRVVVQRASLPNKQKVILDDIYTDILTSIETSPNPTLFALLNLIETSSKKDN